MHGQQNIKSLEINPEGSQGPAWTVEPVEEKKNNNIN